MNNQKILISGAGIAGLTLAYWLKKYGFTPVIIEKATSLRAGGYGIDFWGLGYEVAQRMDIIEALEKENLRIPEIIFVNEDNKKVGGFKVCKIGPLIENKYMNLLRSGLEKVLYETIKNDVEVWFGKSIEEINQDENSVSVVLNDGRKHTFDLLIGADGLHSNVRAKVFGQEKEFDKYLGYYTSSFTIDNFIPDNRAFYSFSIPGKQVAIYSVPNNKLTTFFIYKQKYPIKEDYRKQEIAKRILRDEFVHVPWETSRLLSEMDKANDFYFDTVSQIQMSQWFKDRITLVGDACQCVSLISGQGSALAMAGAYVLAGELKASSGDHKKAFKNYQQIMLPQIEIKQKMAQDFAGSFIPESKLGLWLRDVFTNLMFIPGISKIFINKFLKDNIKLKTY